MGELETITFKMPPEDFEALLVESGRLDMSRSHYIRECLRLGGEMIKAAPELLTADDQRVARGVRLCSKIMGTLRGEI